METTFRLPSLCHNTITITFLPRVHRFNVLEHLRFRTRPSLFIFSVTRIKTSQREKVIASNEKSLLEKKIIATHVISSNDFLPTIVLQSPSNNDLGVFMCFSKTTILFFKIIVLKTFVKMIMKSLFKCVKSLLCLV